MKNLTTVLTAAIVALVIVVGAFSFYKPEPVIVPSVGSVPTLDGVDFPYYSIGGIRYYNYEQSISATSSAICSARVQATSTLESASVFAATSDMVAVLAVDISTSTTQYGSSTPGFVSSWPAPAGVGFSIVYNGVGTTTSSKVIGLTPSLAYGHIGASDNIIYPGQYVNVRLATTTPGTFNSYLKGTCGMVFREIK